MESTDSADLSLRSRASKSVLSSHVGGSLSLDGRGHSSLSTAAHNPHHSLNPSDCVTSPITDFMYDRCSSVNAFPTTSRRASSTSPGEMRRALCNASSLNLLNIRPNISFLPEVMYTCLLRYSSDVNPVTIIVNEF